MYRLSIVIFAFVLSVTACTQKVDKADQNKAAVQRYVELLNQKDWAEQVGFIFTHKDFEDFKKTHSQFRTAFPDYHYSLELIMAKGDTVINVGTVTATHMAEFPFDPLKGIAPTGKKLKWKEVWINYMKDGKFSGGYLVSDRLDVLHQLGINCLPEERKTKQ